MPKKGRKKKPKPVPESPTWDCESGSLPVESFPSSTQQPACSASPHPDDGTSTPALTEPVPSATFLNRQSHNGRRTHWQAWQDRYLVQEVLKLRPFQQPAGKLRDAAWDQLAQELFNDSSKVGPKSVIDRTGDACWTRFKKLLEFHKVCLVTLLCFSHDGDHGIEGRDALIAEDWNK